MFQDIVQGFQTILILKVKYIYFQCNKNTTSHKKITSLDLLNNVHMGMCNELKALTCVFIKTQNCQIPLLSSINKLQQRILPKPSFQCTLFYQVKFIGISFHI